MPYKVNIVESDPNNKFLNSLPKSILPEFKKSLSHLGNYPYLGRSLSGVISAYVYSFKITHRKREYNFAVSYKIDESNNTINIINLGKQSITRLK
ncbi:MAG: hypothetical protein SCARUB_02841 [Candidatus Scalindua rubra]|uniref:Uncharacterized protein n=1 Tax=Candidatus Scalindua rubra TaxID=1872076 RepID=A0A1E3X8R7_9BACT|nr:MAG: hypothetical protein SCARUB_02841 [Candidatus Scalindua rubra]